MTKRDPKYASTSNRKSDDLDRAVYIIIIACGIISLVFGTLATLSNILDPKNVKYKCTDQRIDDNVIVCYHYERAE